jgi:hypothetical protein
MGKQIQIRNMKNYTIIIPHKHTELNDLSLELNLRMLQENSANKDYELIIAEEEMDPYRLWNHYSEKAKHDILVFSNSDVLMAKDWDLHLIESVCENSIVTGYLVECGVIGVASENVHANFGNGPKDFRREDFENFCVEHSSSVADVKNERGWYMPCAISKSLFMKMGMFDVSLPFPNPNDSIFWDKCIAEGVQLKRAKSYAYHFQNLSNKEHEYKRV